MNLRIRAYVTVDGAYGWRMTSFYEGEPNEVCREVEKVIEHYGPACKPEVSVSFMSDSIAGFLTSLSEVPVVPASKVGVFPGRALLGRPQTVGMLSNLVRD